LLSTCALALGVEPRDIAEDEWLSWTAFDPIHGARLQASRTARTSAGDARAPDRNVG
jgi:hypothetical protein